MGTVTGVMGEKCSKGASVWLCAVQRFLDSPWAIWTVLAVAAFVRLFGLGAKSLWHDEAWSLTYAQTSIPYQLQHPTMAPPLYHLLLHFWLLLGQSDAWLRLPSALAGVAAVWVAFLIGQRLAGRLMGLALSFLNALSPMLVWHAQEARYYSFLYLFSALSLHYYLRVKEETGRWVWLGYLGASLLAIYTHYYALMLILVENLDFLIGLRERSIRRQWGRWMLAQVVLALGFLPWILNFLQQARAAAQGTIFYSHPEPSGVLESFRTFVAGRIQVIPDAVILLLLALAAGWGARLALRQRRPLVVWLLLLTVPVVLAYLISLWVPIYETKHLIATALACYVLIAYAVVLSRQWLLSVGAMGAFLVVGVVGLAGIYLVPPRQDWRQVAALVEANQQPGDVVLFDGHVGYLGFSRYYDGTLDLYGLYERPPKVLQEAADPRSVVWVDYGVIGGYFPQQPLPDTTWRMSSEKIRERYRRAWLVLFWGLQTLEEHEAGLGAYCHSVRDRRLLGFWGEIELYRCNLRAPARYVRR